MSPYDSEGVKWIRDLLLIPIIVSCTTVVITLGLPRLWPENTAELSYEIRDRSGRASPSMEEAVTAAESISVALAEIFDKRVFQEAIKVDFSGYEVRLWNSGDLPLRNIPVRFTFATSNEHFAIQRVLQSTTPRLEFGTIIETIIDRSTRRYVYELLNPGDEVRVTFLVTAPAKLQAFAKAEGVRVLEVEPPTPGRTDWTSLAPALVALLSSILSIALTRKRMTGGRDRRV